MCQWHSLLKSLVISLAGAMFCQELAAFEPLSYHERRLTSPSGVRFADIRCSRERSIYSRDDEIPLNCRMVYLRFGEVLDPKTRLDTRVFNLGYTDRARSARKIPVDEDIPSPDVTSLPVEARFTYESSPVYPPGFVFVSDLARSVLCLDLHGDNSMIVDGDHEAALLSRLDGSVVRRIPVEELTLVTPAGTGFINGEYYNWLVFAWYDENSDSVFTLCNPKAIAEANRVAETRTSLVIRRISLETGAVNEPSSTEISRMLSDSSRLSRVGSRMAAALANIELPKGDLDASLKSSRCDFERGLARLSIHQPLVPDDIARIITKEIVSRGDLEWPVGHTSNPTDLGKQLIVATVTYGHRHFGPRGRCLLALAADLRCGPYDNFGAVLKRHPNDALDVIDAEFQAVADPEEADEIRRLKEWLLNR